MANSDTEFGLYNKQTDVYLETQYTDGPGGDTHDSTIITKVQSFADVNAAQTHFFTANALTCMNDHATQIEWALVTNGLKYTIAFGIPKNENEMSWSNKWQTQMETLQAAGDWFNPSLSFADSADNIGINPRTGKDDTSPTAGLTRLFCTVTASADHIF